MLRRKIETTLEEWKNDKNHKPLIIKGVRQCGKTSSVLEFAKKNYKHVIYINFYEKKDYLKIFSDSLNVDDLIMNISSFPELKATFETGNTILVFDEIQECPEARTSLKFFKTDGRFDVIGTGSLLGVSGYSNDEQPKSIPVGYETIIDMEPMDFEEFLWANGIKEDLIDKLRECLNKEKEVPESLHSQFNKLFIQYAVVGGMPEAVRTFIETKQMNTILKLQRNIIRDYEDDMIKYANDNDKPNIRECFESIPRQLAKENKKFQYSTVKKGSRASQYEGSLKWIEDAGIIARCYNLSITGLPLDGNAIDDSFKVYMKDNGLFVSMLEEGTQNSILNGDLRVYKGAIFENIIADVLSKMGRKLYYFRKDTGLEIDFIIRYKGECVPLEVKANTGNTKSLKTLLNDTDKYHINYGIKLGNYNVGRVGNILTLPLYMAFLLTQY